MSNRAPHRIHPAMIPLACLGLVALLSTLRDPPRDQPRFEEIAQPQRIDRTQIQILRVDGVETKLSDLGDRFLFVNVWASWCGPCVQEMPSIVELAKRLDPERFAVVMAGVERDDVVRDFVAEHGFDLPFYAAKGRLPTSLARSATPATFVIDPVGRIRFEHLGATDWATPEAIQFLERLAAP